MSYTQVYVTGLARAINPSDAEIEAYLCKRYSLAGSTAADDNSNCEHNTADKITMWAGEGSTLIKRDDENGCCRGFAFLTFFSVDGAMMIIDRINNDNSDNNGVDHNIMLRAELSNPKGGTKKKSNKKKNNEDNDLPDLRLRRQRKLPVRKHPVITSSDGKRTNLGSKTK